jgi:hypothetical protein
MGKDVPWNTWRYRSATWYLILMEYLLQYHIVMVVRFISTATGAYIGGPFYYFGFRAYRLWRSMKGADLMMILLYSNPAICFDPLIKTNTFIFDSWSPKPLQKFF